MSTYKAPLAAAIGLFDLTVTQRTHEMLRVKQYKRKSVGNAKSISPIFGCEKKNKKITEL